MEFEQGRVILVITVHILVLVEAILMEGIVDVQSCVVIKIKKNKIKKTHVKSYELEFLAFGIYF